MTKQYVKTLCPTSYNKIDSINPYKINVAIYSNGKPIEINEENVFFFSDSGREYELKFTNANSKPNSLNVGVQTNVPGPSYELLIEREYEWTFWIINGVIMLFALICGYYGFRKKPAGKAMYN